MKKIRLALASLDVESFAVLPTRGSDRGTVHAQSGMQWCTYGMCYTAEPCPLTLQSVECTYTCEPTVPQSQDCPEVIEQTLVDPGC